MKRGMIVAACLLAALGTLPGCGSSSPTTGSTSGSSGSSSAVNSHEYLSTVELDEEKSYGGVTFQIGKDWTVETSDESVLSYNFGDGIGYMFVSTVLHGQTSDVDTAWNTFFKEADCKDYNSKTKGRFKFNLALTKYDESNIFTVFAKDPDSDKGFLLAMSFDNSRASDSEQKAFFDRFTDAITWNPTKTTVDYEDWWAEQEDNEAQSTNVQAQKKGFAETTLSQLGTFDETTSTGSGDGVVDIPSPGVPCLMEIHNSGPSNFAVHTVDSSGENVDLLINEIGQYDGVVTDYTDYKSVTMLSIHSSGNWSITFRPLSAMQKIENGAQLQGDNVVYIDESTLSKINITNNGESNFAVKGIGMSKSSLLVNEIGNYSGTVIWNQPQSFFIVHSSGQWSISW